MKSLLHWGAGLFGGLVGAVASYFIFVEGLEWGGRGVLKIAVGLTLIAGMGSYRLARMLTGDEARA